VGRLSKPKAPLQSAHLLSGQYSTELRSHRVDDGPHFVAALPLDGLNLSCRSLQDRADLLALSGVTGLDGALHHAGKAGLGAQALQSVNPLMDQPPVEHGAQHAAQQEREDENQDRLGAGR
jgi:hypothetical protein